MNRSILFILLFSTTLSCKEKEPKDGVSEPVAEKTSENETAYKPKLSLAQWSLHRRYQAKDAKPVNFAKDAKELGFDTVEFVRQS